MIGEMWDLERLCEKAVESGRATCFVSSVPLKVSHLSFVGEMMASVCMLTLLVSIDPRRCSESAERCCHFLDTIHPCIILKPCQRQNISIFNQEETKVPVHFP